MKILKKDLLKYVTALAVIFIAANPHAYADETKASEKEISKEKAVDSEEEVAKAKVLSVAVGDWNEDKRMDSAVLMKTDETVELYLYLANKEGEQEQIVHKKNIVWSGMMDGTEPYLKLKKKTNSLFIYAQNEAIGRNRWHQRLTIAYRAKAFRVVGYTYDEMDTLEADKNGFSCDVNLLTGKGIKDEKNFKIKGEKIKLEDWSTDENILKECMSIE